MRDLANQSIIRKKSLALKKAWILVPVFLLIIVILVISIFKSGGTSSGGDSANLRDAPKGLVPVKINGGLVSTAGGINLTTNSATLSDVKGGGFSGTATRTYGDGSYSLSVSATLPNPKGEFKYEVWLVGGSSIKEVGVMNGSGSSWSIVFNDKDTYSSYREVWVTRQLTTTIGKPENKVLVGNF